MNGLSTVLILLATAFVTLVAAFSPSLSISQNAGGEYNLAEISVGFADDAQVDWHSPGDAAFEIERDMIRILFENASKDGASSVLTGAAPARLEVTITQFDILSTLELFFCCAVNEVAAKFKLTNAEDGEAIRGEDLLVFDHIGRGGVIAAISAKEGNDQLQRLSNIIRDQTASWLQDGD